MAGKPDSSVMNSTFFGEYPCSESSALISSVPMLLVPFTPIFWPTSCAMLATEEPAGVTSTREFRPNEEASARMRNLAPCASAVMYGI
jgi:hypothetical protein